MNIWLFGYGSLMWRPDFDYLDRKAARLHGWQRRFWQGSHDHRGLPHAPGRVVTLIETTGYCDGVAFLVEAAVAAETFEHLDHREKNGYQRIDAELGFRNGEVVSGIVYVASPENHAFLGPASLREMAHQIHRSRGPSGTNREYLTRLADTLRDLEMADHHVFELEAAVNGRQ
ncbi:MAG: gamma-glutamylcyclotransferase [Pseudomonadales bacterium]|jgi:cation transport regulator ChaC|nr:gamma-glutamylcyclotransferase [Pseudomonadales bacterium]MDP6470103.1 gamma-glutamylcyclotransferase [Pseudomonadales bacterium]MDP6827006.1 gamma-glutamylcyclotransferase [Pseudomonadales bacterium]MDP6972064.1 gamma-glutamylcyclotransferase [Pseudomonadales bacterium]|tara:strand:- start:2294 stop:2812 length:519 start_codon:yes stop_codon:yes gene_type:complete